MRIGIEKVRTNLKTNQPEGIEGWRLNNRHVLRSLYCWPCDIRAGTRPDVRHAFSYSLPDRLQNIRVVKRLQESKGITAADEDCLCITDGLLGISSCVD